MAAIPRPRLRGGVLWRHALDRLAYLVESVGRFADDDPRRAILIRPSSTHRPARPRPASFGS